MEQEAEGGNSSTLERVLLLSQLSQPPTMTCPDAGIYCWHSDYNKPIKMDILSIYNKLTG